MNEEQSEQLCRRFASEILILNIQQSQRFFRLGRVRYKLGHTITSFLSAIVAQKERDINQKRKAGKK